MKGRKQAQIEGRTQSKTYFTFKELVIGCSELVLFRRFGNIFNTSQKFVLVQELGRIKCD